MTHLTDGQFEDILQGQIQAPDHLEACPDCRTLLAERRAIAERLRKTFTSVRAGTELASRIRANIEPANGNSPAQTIIAAPHRRLWSGLAAAAAILAIAVPAGLYFNATSQAHAGQTALVEIHNQNLESLDELFVHDNPMEISGYLQNRTGHAPAMLCTGSGLTLCGCCTRQFQGNTVGSYVVRGENGPISIVVIPDSPKSMGMTPQKRREAIERPVWRAQCRGCNMASVRIGEHSYYAVGQVAQEDLDAALSRLLE